VAVDVPEVITCPDCGGRASRLSYVPPDGWEPGMVVAYRCADCLDRWDLPLDDEPDDDPRGSSGW
jgi:DNA-directed RNA polymerase subunit RPC12/RpoP